MTKAEKKKEWKKLKDLVKKRDWDICCHCNEKTSKNGKKKVLHLSHIMPRWEYPHLEFDPDNVVLHCFSCHLKWWHKNPIEAYMWLKEKKWLPFIKKLIKKAKDEKSLPTNKRNKTKNRK